MRINILCRQVRQNITGGNIYDTYLFKCLEQNKNLDIHYITDSQIGCKNLLYYSYSCWKYRGLIKDCDKLIINSSRFSKFLFFLFWLRYSKRSLQVITIHHHFGYRQLQGLKRRVYKWMEIKFLSLCDTIITPNPYVREELLSRFQSSKIAFLELSFDKSIKAQAKPQVGNFLYVGTIEQRKGLKYLIESLGCIPVDVRKQMIVHIVGKVVETSYYNKLLKRIGALGLQDIVRFHGRLSDEELVEAYRNAYCFVFPSLHEGYGMVIVEAMSYGLPVIAFDNSAMPYTIKDGYNGLLVNTGDFREFSKRMQSVLFDDNLRRKLSIGALDTYNKIRGLDELNIDIDNFINSTLLK